MARILSVVWYRVTPPLFGGQKGIAHFNRHLARHHELICLCSADNEPADEGYAVLPQLSVGRWKFLHPGNWIRLFRTIGRLRPTHVIVEHPQYGPIAALMRRWYGYRLVLHAHNIESDLLPSTGKWFRGMTALWEGLALRSADLILFKTEEDRSTAIRRFGVDADRTTLVPFGVEADATPSKEQRTAAGGRIRDRYGIPAGEKLIYFGGTLDYAPNAEAMRWIVEELIPALRAYSTDPFRVVVTGRIRKRGFEWVGDLSDPALVMAGDVEDPVDFMLGSDLLVNPVETGGGIKVKNLEAIANGLTVVTTPHGATGIDGDACGGKLVVARVRDPASFSRLVTEHWDAASDTPDSFYRSYRWQAIIEGVARRISGC